jgi:hypothetical protein
MKHRPSSFVRVVFSLLCIVVFFAVLSYNRQGILDWWHLRHYAPPAAIAELATQDTMTSYARKVLYVNKPQLQSKTSFTECNLGTEQAAILGCYHSNQEGIFILSVSDPRLNGIEQVTAAHEMLHAAYDRLSSRQKKSVDAMLLDYYNHDLHNPTILAQMANYKKTEPDAVVNEMHSVFGTEVDNLPAGLEQYYRRYFTNRSAIAHDYDNYQAEFTSRQTTVANDDRQLATLKKQIDTSEADLQMKSATIQALQSRLTADQNSSDIFAYNAGVPGYNADVDAYNTEVMSLKNNITQYNQLVAARNTVAVESQQLTSEITSQVSSISQ